MEFFVMVLIFISCMIVLALLIYYFQEYRKPKFSLSDNQKDISAIVLAIAAPGVAPVQPDNSGYPPGFKPIFQSPGKSCMAKKSRQPETPSPPCNRRPVIPKEYIQMAMSLQGYSDSSSSSSEQIYYPPKSTAYSVAKKMSVVNIDKLERKISRELTPTLQMASYLMARRLSDTPAATPTESVDEKRSHFSRTHSLPQRPNPLFQNRDGSLRRKVIAKQSPLISTLVAAECAKRKATTKPSPLVSSLVTAEAARQSNSSLVEVHEPTTSSNSEESSSSLGHDAPSPPRRMRKLRSMESNSNGAKGRGARLVKSQSIDIPDEEADEQNLKKDNLTRVTNSERLGTSMERIRRSPTPLHTLAEED